MDLTLDAALAPKSAGRRHSHSFTVADMFKFQETLHIQFTPIHAHIVSQTKNSTLRSIVGVTHSDVIHVKVIDGESITASSLR
jgi:hypothetical protein